MSYKKLCVFLLIFAMASMANAAVLRYAGSGPWEDATRWTPDGTTYPGVLPGTADAARMNWGDNTVTVSSVVPAVRECQAGVDEPGTLHVLSGGVVTTTTWAGPGVAGVCTGTFNIDAGGQMDIGGHLWVGSGPAGNLGIANISGIVNVGGTIGLGTIDAINPSGGNGFVNVNSGVLNLSSILPGLGSIQPGSLLDITGTGQLILPIEYVDELIAYIAAGRIVGEGIVGNVSVDITIPDFVIATATIPEPATMSLLGLGAIALLRKKK